VLYSRQDAAWKVADFGLTMEGSSKGITTDHARGTPCYRAPELVNFSGKSHFTNKVDIWAIGCIQYELLFRKKAFPNDFSVHEYRLKHKVFKSRFNIPKDAAGVLTEHLTKAFLSDVLPQMLEIDASQRPSAKILCALFSNLLDSTNNSTGGLLTKDFTSTLKLGMTGNFTDEVDMLKPKT
jgi:serine/threonine protein kinase